jgi:hypothetical protein
LRIRPRMNDPCKQIAVEKDPKKLEELTRELNDLVEPTLKSVQLKAGGNYFALA